MNTKIKTYGFMTAGMLGVAAVFAPLMIFLLGGMPPATLPEGCNPRAYVRIGGQVLALPRESFKKQGAVPCDASQDNPYVMNALTIDILPVAIEMPGKERHTWNGNFKMKISPWDGEAQRPADIVAATDMTRTQKQRALAKMGFDYPNMHLSTQFGHLDHRGELLLLYGCEEPAEILSCSMNFVWKNKIVVEVIPPRNLPLFQLEQIVNSPASNDQTSAKINDLSERIGEVEAEISEVKIAVAEGVAYPEALEGLEEELEELENDRHDALLARMDEVEEFIDNMEKTSRAGPFYVPRTVYRTAFDFMKDSSPVTNELAD